MTDRRQKISKTMAYFLRHHPQSADLEPDQYGFVSLSALTKALAERISNVSADTVRRVVAKDPKRRYEIAGDRIRATYGHSIEVGDIGKPCEPPEQLYHGTPREKVTPIRENGLQPMGRQWVHLSATIEDAMTVGRRRDTKPAIFAIDPRKAAELGIQFRKSGTVYLAQFIPPQCLQLLPDQTQ